MKEHAIIYFNFEVYDSVCQGFYENTILGNRV